MELLTQTSTLSFRYVVALMYIHTKDPFGVIMERAICSLQDVLQKKSHLDINKFRVQWMVQVAKAIIFLHEKKVFHRDLKSSNVLVSC